VTTFIAHLSYAMQRVGLAYVFYLAIEPYARRLWPRILTSWVRVLEGRFADSLVGRDLLIGSVGGAAQALLGGLATWVPEKLGGPSALPVWTEWTFESLRGPVHAIVAVLGVHTQQLLEIVYPLTLLLILRLLLRRTDAAIAAVSLLALVIFYPDSGSIPGYLVGIGLAMVISWLVLVKAGLLGFAAMFLLNTSLRELPLMPRPAGWFTGVRLLLLAFVVAPALYGFWRSQAGRPLFGDELLGTAKRTG
jgi:hypothetical protein